MVLAAGLFGSVGILLAHDIVMAMQLRSLLARQRSGRRAYRKREGITLVMPHAGSKHGL